MIVDTALAGLTLQPGRLARLRLRAGTRLRGLRGTTWLTIDGLACDKLLEPGDEWVLGRSACLLACALHADGQAELAVDEPDPAPRRGRPAWWRRWALRRGGWQAVAA